METPMSRRFFPGPHPDPVWPPPRHAAFRAALKLSPAKLHNLRPSFASAEEADPAHAGDSLPAITNSLPDRNPVTDGGSLRPFLSPVPRNPILAGAAAIDSRSGNRVRNPRRTSGLASAPHTPQQRCVLPQRRQSRLRLRISWPVRIQPTIRSSLSQSPGTWDCARSGTRPQPPAASAEQPEPAFRVRSIQNPTRSAKQPRIPKPMEAPQSTATVPHLRPPHGNPATAEAARTRVRRRRRLPREPRPQLASDVPAMPPGFFRNVRLPWVLHLLLLTLRSRRFDGAGPDKAEALERIAL